MKTYIKYIALLGVALFFNSCSDDDLENEKRTPVRSGDEISFGASAFTKVGNNGAKEGRTIYGDVNEAGDKIAVNWCYGDNIDIYSPEAAGINLASYCIPVGTNVAGTTTSSATSATLDRVTEAGGLQWNGPEVHNFYGIYPASHVFKKYEGRHDPASFSIDKASKIARGHMPMTFTATVDKQSDGINYIVKPNMDFAFMVAKASSTMEQVNAGQTLGMEFHPLTTALEFDITAGLISAPNAAQANQIEVTHLSLISSSENIAGDFEYNFETGQLTNTSHLTQTEQTVANEELSSNRINMYLASSKDNTSADNEPVMLQEGGKLNVTFFLLGDTDIAKKNLALQIWYEADGIPRVCTARIGIDIQIRHKYSFKNMKMPDLLNLTGSNWFSAIEPDVYVNQLSLLCAGNAFSNVQGIPWSSREQVAPYDELWKHGVRGFEMVTQSCAVNGDESIRTVQALGAEHFVCGEIEMDGSTTSAGQLPTSTTFHQAFSNLVKYLVDHSEKYKDYNKETLVLIMRYHAVNDGYSPQRYVNDLLDYLQYAIDYGIDSDGSTIKLTRDNFVKLTANSTVKDLQGKIAIIIRPGDDDYMKWTQNGKTTKDIQVVDRKGVDWSDKVCLVENWGSAYDRWDTRYVSSSGQPAAREATWALAINSGAPIVEQALWGVHSSSTNWGRRPAKDFGNFSTEFQSQFNFALPIRNSTLGAYIQEWCRVIPPTLDNTPVCGYPGDDGARKANTLGGTGGTGYLYLWYKWPSSYNEKLKGIDNVLTKVVQSKGGSDNPLYINVLSGYFATSKHMNSLEPFMATFNDESVVFEPHQQGNGGNYAALATRLNTYLYNVLSGVGNMHTDGTRLQQGPWGLVVADYLNATDAQLREAQANEYCSDEEIVAGSNATYNLQRMFISNNFTFPLKKANVAAETADVEMGGTVQETLITE